jgi:hypothetical protein
LVVAIAVVAMGTINVGGQRRSANPRNPRLPAGFRELDADFWRGPWLFDRSGPTARALPAFHNALGEATNGSVPVRLDDGGSGSLRVESKPCAAADDCEPFDCGCPLENESYWLEVVDSQAKSVARLHLWAAYGIFDIVPIDLVDGPGDELVIIRVPAHASPPIGHDLKIWKLGPTKPVELTDPLRVAGVFETELIGCARWRTRLFVDLKEAKPRAVVLRSEFAATVTGFDTAAICRLEGQEAHRVAALRRQQVLRVKSGKYRLR